MRWRKVVLPEPAMPITTMQTGASGDEVGAGVVILIVGCGQ